MNFFGLIGKPSAGMVTTSVAALRKRLTLYPGVEGQTTCSTPGGASSFQTWIVGDRVRSIAVEVTASSLGTGSIVICSALRAAQISRSVRTMLRLRLVAS